MPLTFLDVRHETAYRLFHAEQLSQLDRVLYAVFIAIRIAGLLRFDLREAAPVSVVVLFATSCVRLLMVRTALGARTKRPLCASPDPRMSADRACHGR